ncbi:hypothetical protein [Klebsiella aerogenes]|uniref:hypothetical protein n=1 Tax=Klebsiella aerogenes TaxID=548 RepID=UPI001D0F36F8|nr:hypothetical protein [Klebsiella aerogenes]
MNNEIEQIAQQNDMSIEFVRWFFNEKKAACGEHWFLALGAMWEGWKAREGEVTAMALTLEKSREASGCPAGVDLQDWVKQLAEENVQVRERHRFIRALAVSILEHSGGRRDWRGAMEDASDLVKTVDEVYCNTPATDRIVAGIKADEVAEREKIITFTAAKKRTQDGVALIAIGKPYKIHNDDVIGEFFIGERGRYGVITMDRLNYFTTSDEYAWEFSLREGADK